MFCISTSIMAIVAFLTIGGHGVLAKPIPDRGDVVLQFPTNQASKNQPSAFMHMIVEELNGGGTSGGGRRGLRAFDYYVDWSSYTYRNSNGWIYSTIESTSEAADRILRNSLDATDAFEVHSCSNFACYGFLDWTKLSLIEEVSTVLSVQPLLSFYRNPWVGEANNDNSHNTDGKWYHRRVQEELTPELPPPGGMVNNHAVEALQVDKVRAKYPDLTGAGMKIGVISSGFNTKGGYDADMASGDLPSDVVVLQESPFPTRDDGRAMLQLIHDLTPDATLYFHSAVGGPFDFALAVQRLADEGCDVIVDDVLDFFEPWFQEGIMTQAANDVAEFRGIPYFSAAGNSGRNSWEGAYNGIPCTGFASCHDFGNGIPVQRITVTKETVLFVQWDDPWISVSGPPGAGTDVDALLFDPSTGEFVFGLGIPNIGIDPTEPVVLPPGTWDLVFGHYGGPEPTVIKWMLQDDSALVQSDPPANSATIGPQAKASYTAGVGAVFEQQVFSELKLESFSSTGGIPWLFDHDGSRKAEPLVTNQPRFVGPDGSFNTFFGLYFDDPRPDVDSNFRFFGTSAAAPNVAAIALLMLQANPLLAPSRVYEIMEETALDMNQVGFDFDSGHGLVNALAAVEMAMAEGQDNDNRGGKKKSKKWEAHPTDPTCDFTFDNFMTTDSNVLSLSDEYGIGNGNGKPKKDKVKKDKARGNGST